jgi:hypothetical protein
MTYVAHYIQSRQEKIVENLVDISSLENNNLKIFKEIKTLAWKRY